MVHPVLCPVVLVKLSLHNSNCLDCTGMQTLLGEGAKVVLEGQRVLPARAQEQGFDFKFDDVDIAVRDIVST